MKDLFAWVESVHPSACGGHWTPINRGGSDRQFWRGSGSTQGLVAVLYGAEKEENARYAHCAEFLRAQEVRVPALLAHDAAAGRMLMEDAGSEDLWTYRNAPWGVRRGLYGKALREAARLHTVSLSEAQRAGVLNAPFDAALYRWEQDYFLQNFLGGPRGAAVQEGLPFAAQAEQLAGLPRVPVHRDFQSQNVMVRNAEVMLIDFQGMRAGLAGYDVASLLYDPYVDFTDEERSELTAVYLSLAQRSGDDAWRQELQAAARQRLMQALGAYGFLGRVKGKTAFLSHIPAAAERLAALCEVDPEWLPLSAAVREAAAEFKP